ncbi:NAD(P)-binding protein [Thozetella sp. PMI_491]|nr:NAD(P)-binding protein [Thozetella sp. PMI_491]
MMKMKVAIVGATGETGWSIVNGLLESLEPRFELVALTRPSSFAKPRNIALQQRGVKLVATDLDGPEEELVKSLAGNDVLISALNPSAFAAQIPLANAAKLAHVRRFIPCSFATVGPPRGKEDIFDHVKKLHLPYTIIDVGWWFQLSIPRVASGRTDYATIMPANTIAGNGDVPSALTDSRDIGRWVARIISDDRTLNKMVLAYNEVLSQNQVISLFEKLSGEMVERNTRFIDITPGQLPEERIHDIIRQAEKSNDPKAIHQLWSMQYLHSFGIRGDNTPSYAEYLGYIDATKLYPDVERTSLESFFQEVLSGNAVAAYVQQRVS